MRSRRKLQVPQHEFWYHHLRWVSSLTMGKITYYGYDHLRPVKSPTMGIINYEKYRTFQLPHDSMFTSFLNLVEI